MTTSDRREGIRQCVLQRAVFTLVLLVFLWRLLDFIDEALSGNFKMSLGSFHLTGYVAAIVQIAVMTLLLFVASRMIGTLRTSPTR